ncbi:hypothetical protein Glove_200g7 [Diversispora epigaea]|uniref:Uncharacterized protein n=1 Tax=Diversispora epigaea TaxID=1348612 RepID=A0A397IR38_9GLOM|nr:hypothetical protein Glove_200g7 [Diversispora epigaea]
MIISDWPEACIFALTYKSTKSNYPCHFCLVSKEDLSNINLNNNQIELRSHNNMKLYYKNNTGKNISIENVRNFFWSVPNINIYAATVPDRMHHLNLGLFQHQLNFTKILILKQCGKSVIDKMNNRVKLIPHYQDLKSFPDSFLHLTLLIASEYRSLMKIMIFIVDELYEDSGSPNFIKNNKITEVYLKWNKIYLLSRKENYEESDVTLLQLQFPKLHSWVFHICSSIREFGTINRYTTETYESLHKNYVKKPYKLTNKKEIEKQIIKIIRRKAIITESSSKEIPKTPIALKYSKKLYEFCIQNAEIYIQTRMNDPDLEKEMKLGFEKFLECLDYQFWTKSSQSERECAILKQLNQMGFLVSTPIHMPNSTRIFWNCFKTALDNNKKNCDGKRRILSIIADKFTYAELKSNLNVGNHTIFESRKHARINGYGAPPLIKPIISHVKLKEESLKQFELFFTNKKNVNMSSYKTDNKTGLPVLYLQDHKQVLWKKFHELYSDGMHRTSFIMRLNGERFQYKEDLGGLCMTCNECDYLIFTEIEKIIDTNIIDPNVRVNNYNYNIKQLQIDDLGNAIYNSCISHCLQYAFGNCNQSHPEICQNCENLLDFFAKLHNYLDVIHYQTLEEYQKQLHSPSKSICGMIKFENNC